MVRRQPSVTERLLTYRRAAQSGETTFHLRFNNDRSGVLFVNVSEVLHLSPTAATMTQLLLDGKPEGECLKDLRRSYRGVTKDQLQRDLASVRETLDRLTLGAECPACDLAVTRSPLFSNRPTAPYKADLALTYQCNNGCTHCYNEPGRKRLPSLSLAEWKHVVDRLTAVGVPHLIFTGGEPTVHPSLLALIRYAKAAGHICGMNTNGRRLADMGFGAELKGVGLDHVQVTLESHNREVHDGMVGVPAFEETVTGLRSALAARLHTITNTTLTARNAPGILDTVDFLHQLGLRTFALNAMIHSGCGTAHPEALEVEYLAPLLSEVRDRAAERGMRFLWYSPTEYCRLSPLELGVGVKRCNAGEYSICVEPNGDVLPCQSYYVPAGNLLRDDWDRIWQSSLFRSFRERTEHPQQCELPQRCWDCPDLPVCGGGCRLERELGSKGTVRLS